MPIRDTASLLAGRSAVPTKASNSRADAHARLIAGPLSRLFSGSDRSSGESDLLTACRLPSARIAHSAKGTGALACEQFEQVDRLRIELVVGLVGFD